VWTNTDTLGKSKHNFEGQAFLHLCFSHARVYNQRMFQECLLVLGDAASAVWPIWLTRLAGLFRWSHWSGTYRLHFGLNLRYACFACYLRLLVYILTKGLGFQSSDITLFVRINYFILINFYWFLNIFIINSYFLSFNMWKFWSVNWNSLDIFALQRSGLNLLRSRWLFELLDRNRWINEIFRKEHFQLRLHG